MAKTYTIKKRNKFQTHLHLFYKERAFWIMAALPIIWFLLFRYWSMFGVLIGFQNYRLGSPFIGEGTEWVGLKWFEKLVTSPKFGRYIANTIIISLLDMFITFPIAIIFALLLNEIRNKFARKFVANVSLLPHFISTVVVVGMMFNLFSVDDGVVNKLIESLGGQAVDFMGESGWFRTMFTGSGIWQNTGFSAVVFTAAIAGIDPALYEAAAIDGSDRLKNIIHITIPCILPTIIIMWLLKIGSIMSVSYEKIILMYSSTNIDVADVLSTYAYRVGIGNSKYSLSTAISLFNSACNVVLIIIANKITKKISDTSLW